MLARREGSVCVVGEGGLCVCVCACVAERVSKRMCTYSCVSHTSAAYATPPPPTTRRRPARPFIAGTSIQYLRAYICVFVVPLLHIRGVIPLFEWWCVALLIAEGHHETTPEGWYLRYMKFSCISPGQPATTWILRLHVVCCMALT